MGTSLSRRDEATADLRLPAEAKMPALPSAVLIQPAITVLEAGPNLPLVVMNKLFSCFAAFRLFAES